MIYEIKKYPKGNRPHGGCATAVVLLVICILFGMLVSCKKDTPICPQLPVVKFRKCLDCKPVRPNVLDTTIRKQN